MLDYFRDHLTIVNCLQDFFNINIYIELEYLFIRGILKFRELVRDMSDIFVVNSGCLGRIYVARQIERTLED